MSEVSTTNYSWKFQTNMRKSAWCPPAIPIRYFSSEVSNILRRSKQAIYRVSYLNVSPVIKFLVRCKLDVLIITVESNMANYIKIGISN